MWFLGWCGVIVEWRNDKINDINESVLFTHAFL